MQQKEMERNNAEVKLRSSPTIFHLSRIRSIMNQQANELLAAGGPTINTQQYRRGTDWPLERSRKIDHQRGLQTKTNTKETNDMVHMTKTKQTPRLCESGSRWSCFSTSPGPTRRASTTSQPPTRPTTVELPLTGKGVKELKSSVPRGVSSSSDGSAEPPSSLARNAFQSSSNARRRGGGWEELSEVEHEEVGAFRE